MTHQEVTDLVVSMNIDHPDGLCFKAAVILFTGLEHGWDEDYLCELTKLLANDVSTIINNWTANEILVADGIVIEFDLEDPNVIFEIALICLCGSGEIISRKVDENGKVVLNFADEETITQPEIINMKASKTLNDHLFDQLDRLSEATPENIDCEVSKASYMIKIADKILDVARFKLDVIKANGGMSENFTELDTPKSNRPIEIGGTEGDKKKLN